MTTATQIINGDLLRTVAKLVESPHWKESLKILKLAVTRSSTLVAPPSTGAMSFHWETTSASNFAEADMYFKKELPGKYFQRKFTKNGRNFSKNAQLLSPFLQVEPWNSLLTYRKHL